MAYMTSKKTVASLFAGAGGMDIGFHEAGFDVVWANDIDKDACETHRMWSGSEVVCSDVATLNPAMMPTTDIITGGFPCQGFSLAGPRKIDDSRNILYRHFVRCVKEKQPLAFVAENVKGILTLGGGSIIKAIASEFNDNGYDVVYDLLDASDFSVPQERHRVIIVGIRKDFGRTFEFPSVHDKVISMRDAIGNMSKPDPVDICSEPYSSRYMSRNRRRSWDHPSFTIPAMAKQVPLHPSSPNMKYIGKDLWEFGEGETRRLSWIEAAAIQTFPYGMEFCGNLTSKYKQIGNAVPCRLAKSVAKELLTFVG